MAVDPSYQRNGIGSALLKMFCHYIDENALDAFVMSSPAGVRLYSNFGFKAVGVVETKHGNFTSMLRTSGFMGNNGNVCEEGKLMANSHHCYEE
ncbi:hypothetical protein N7509_006281 [Penicillium cosmopolitanum]|uniref:N-acetyltransferase domain-containing protein n=1 Tax=Penicillium cosmopolitanum TaxID=1131564 RepID=A0A9W9W3U7_9EURO|nr:uncharacterized protein N7509_006281 [Penicillium cosmopolitanum]KAJ5398168.1 hypothetical protein N7509_006281 [Penicillium cosmopolitanum]